MSGKSKRKGRGHQPRQAAEDMDGRGGMYDASESGTGPLKSEEGWVIFIRGVHEEAQEEDILDAFGEYGDVRNIHVNLDRRTGFVKGYVLIEYAERKEADAAIKAMNGADMLGQTLGCDFAFREGPRTRRS